MPSMVVGSIAFLLVMMMMAETSLAFTTMITSLGPNHNHNGRMISYDEGRQTTTKLLQRMAATDNDAGVQEESGGGNWWEPKWTEVEILSNEKACGNGRCRTIKVNAPEELQKEYRAPGQYVQVRLVDQEDQLCFVPISSSPRKDYFEFLIKDNNEEKLWLFDLPVGTTLQLSDNVLGKGFQPREIPTMKPATTIMDASNIIMACNGLGLSSLKAAIESGRLPGGTLYYGERTIDDLCYTDQFEIWEKEYNFRVIPVLSQQQPEQQQQLDGSDYRQGYVQDAIKDDKIEGDPDQCYALLCGVMEMMDGVTDYLKEEGLSPTRIMLNLEA